MNDFKYDVSVLMGTYNPDYKKEMMTVRSVMLQKGVKFQIVLCDDGSHTDYFEELRNYFENNGFAEYALVKNEVNNGTVMNVHSGMDKCRGKYLFFISPGDCLADEMALKDWITYMESRELAVCGADYVCYNQKSGTYQSLKCSAHPQKISCSPDKIRYGYVIFNDIFNGAAVLCLREVFESYLNLIVGKVKFAQDNIYRIMAYCGEKMGFYDKCEILYEFGSGISTSNNDVWISRINADWNATDAIMLTLKGDKKIMKYFPRIVKLRKMRGRKILYLLSIRGLVLFKIQCKLKPRYSYDKLSSEWINQLNAE